MMETENYQEKLCNEKHGNIEKRFQTIDKRLDSHSQDISEIKEAVIELKQISRMLAEKQPDHVVIKTSFWETKSGGRVLTFLFILVGALTGAAIGINILQYIPVK